VTFQSHRRLTAVLCTFAQIDGIIIIDNKTDILDDFVDSFSAKMGDIATQDQKRTVVVTGMCTITPMAVCCIS
jgi:hypothetical protein